MGPTWGPHGSCWPQMDPMNLAIRDNHYSRNKCRQSVRQQSTSFWQWEMVHTTHYTDMEMVRYHDAIMGAMASQITSLTIVYSTVYSGLETHMRQWISSLGNGWSWHGMKQWLLIINWTRGDKLQWLLNQNASSYNNENAIEQVIITCCPICSGPLRHKSPLYWYNGKINLTTCMYSWYKSELC